MPARNKPDIERIRQLIAAGATNRQIADRLGCSVDVVQRQRQAANTRR